MTMHSREDPSKNTVEITIATDINVDDNQQRPFSRIADINVLSSIAAVNSDSSIRKDTWILNSRKTTLFIVEKYIKMY